MVHRLQSALPGISIRLSAEKFAAVTVQPYPEGLVIQLLAIQAKHSELFGQQPVTVQGINRRHQLAPGQIPAGTEYHHDMRWHRFDR